MNKVILMGRLTATPELKQSQSGMYITRFSVAVDRPTKQGQEKQTDFVTCTAFGKTAEFITRYFEKGRRILLSGSIKTGSYQDKNYPDVKHFTFEVWVETVEFVENKPQEQSQNGYQHNTYQQTAAPVQQPQQMQQMQMDSYGNIRPAPGQQAVQGMIANAQAAGVPVNLNDFEEIIGDSQLPF